MPRRRQCCLGVVQCRLRAGNLCGRVAMLRTLFARHSGWPARFPGALARPSLHSATRLLSPPAWSARPNRVAPGRAPAGPAPLRSGRLLLGLRAVMRRRVQRGLRRLHRALRTRHLGARRHVIQCQNQLAAVHQVALLRIHALHRGGKRTVELDNSQSARLCRWCLRCSTATGAPPAPHAPATGPAERTAPSRNTAIRIDCRTDPKPFAAHLRSCFSHAFNQSQYIRLESLKLRFRQIKAIAAVVANSRTCHVARRRQPAKINP